MQVELAVKLAQRSVLHAKTRIVASHLCLALCFKWTTVVGTTARLCSA
jgi:hypothetical protein